MLLEDFSGGTPALTQCVHTGYTVFSAYEQTFSLSPYERGSTFYFSVEINPNVTPVKGESF